MSPVYVPDPAAGIQSPYSVLTTVPAFLDSLCSALAAREGLAGVAICSGPFGEEDKGLECIVVGEDVVSVEAEYPTVPQLECFENFDVTGYVKAVKDGIGEAAIKSARDRAYALLEQLHNDLATNDTTAKCNTAYGVDDARMVRWELAQAVGDGLRLAHINFTIRVKARFTPA